MAEKKKSKLDQILGKLTEHDKRFDAHDKRFDAHDKRFDAYDKRFDAHDNNFKNIANKLLDHDRKFDEMNNKIDDKFDQVLTGQDKIMKELEDAREDRALSLGQDKKQDQRIGALEGRMNRIEEKVGV